MKKRFYQLIIYCILHLVISLSTIANDTVRYVWIEAEDGGEHNPIIVKSDQAASQQIYLASWRNDNALLAPPEDGYIIYSFNITSADTFRLWIRAITPDTASNSYWLQVDNGAWMVWENIGPFDSWAWANFDTTLIEFNL